MLLCMSAVSISHVQIDDHDLAASPSILTDYGCQAEAHTYLTQLWFLSTGYPRRAEYYKLEKGLSMNLI